MVNRFRRPIKRKASRGAHSTASQPVEVRVERIGARGDGVAEGPDGPLFIPLTAPGDLVLARPGAARGTGQAATLDRVIEASPDRVSPPCLVYGRCGGCALQHVTDAVAAQAKTGWLTQALSARGLSGVPIRPIQSCPTGERRRARLAARRTAQGWVIGFNEAMGARIIAIEACPALHPDLAHLPGRLRALLEKLPGFGAAGDILIARTDSGTDLVLYPQTAAEPGLADREALLAWAQAEDLARIAWAPRPDQPPEPVMTRRPPMEQLGTVVVEVPPGAFLQPSRAGEAAIRALVTEAVAEAPALADLYAGLGTLGLSLAEAGRLVHAVEGDGAMVTALRKAAGARGLRLTAECRDLAREPMPAQELERFAAVVFDPPRAGAEAQARALADSTVPRVVAVSCNPATLARDLRILVDGGYRLDWVAPVDQFPWSAHLEAVACLSRHDRGL